MTVINVSQGLLFDLSTLAADHPHGVCLEFASGGDRLRVLNHSQLQVLARFERGVTGEWRQVAA